MSDVPSIPRIAGTDLSRQRVEVPRDLPPGPCLLLLVFSPAQQHEAQSWGAVLRDFALSGRSGVRQIVVLPTLMKLGEAIALAELKKAIPLEAQPHTVLAFADGDPIARAVGAPDTKHVAVALLDASHGVLWCGTGAHTPAAEAALREKAAPAA